MVRSLCVTALEVREQLEKSAPSPIIRKSTTTTTTSRHRPSTNADQNNAHGNGSLASSTNLVSPVKRKSISMNTPIGLDSVSSPTKRLRPEISTPDPTQTPVASASIQSPAKRAQNHSSIPVPLFAPPPSARQPLEPHHVLEAFSQIQREQAF